MKVLVLSHNSISSDTNMGFTARNLLREFESKELCQINIKDNSKDKCKISTIVINEKDLLKTRFTKHGFWFIPDSKKEKSNLNTTSAIKERNKNSAILLIRHYLWKFSNWYNKTLDKWIINESPDSILVLPGDSTFIYNIALKISKKHKISIISYFGDDYITEKENFDSKTSFFDKIYDSILFKKIKELVDSSTGIVFISKSLEKNTKKEFGIKSNTKTIFTPYSSKNDNSHTINYPLRILYAGNLSLGRFESLLHIARVIEKINKSSTKYILDIYGPKPSNTNIDNIRMKNINYNGVISQSEVEQEIKKSDILLHVESFNPQIIGIIKHSFSTKLSNYLASNRVILAYGSLEVNSIKYLQENNCAFVTDRISDLEKCSADNHQ